MVRSFAALACLLVVVSCTSPGESLSDAQSTPEATSPVAAGAQSGPEATSVAAIEANPVLARFDCAYSDPWTDGDDLQIFFDPEADNAVIDATLVHLGQLSQVERSVYFDKAASFVEFSAFRDSYGDDWPAGMDISIDEVPTRVGLVVAAPIDNNVAELTSLYQNDPLVFRITPRPVFCTSSREDIEVLCTELDLQRHASLFIDPSAPDSEARRLREMLEAIDVFESITFVSQDEALANFETMFGDQPINDSFERDQIPSHWNFTVPLDADVTSLFVELKQDPAVFDVTVAAFCDPTEW